MPLGSYELISVLDKDKHSYSRIFKVKEKTTGNYYVWNIIDAESLTEQQIAILEDKFKQRKPLEHPNLLDFYELFKENESNLFYLVVKHCRHGSLKDIMDLAFRDNSRICEEFLCKVLYQIALVVKTINIITKFDIKDIFFDEAYSVKLFNFDSSASYIKIKNPKTSSLGIMMFEVCTLTKFKKSNFEKELKNYVNYYSKGFLSLIITMIKDNSDLKKNIDKILCNSTLLLKATQWNKQKVLIKIDHLNNGIQLPEKAEDVLKEKEIILQKKERELKQREQKLERREKQIALMEQHLQEQLKKTSNINCQCKVSKSTEQIGNKENLDSTYVSCGDSIIMPTSKKLNVNEIIKPATFTRTFSEKKIKFKGHSPLKDMDFNKRRSLKHSKSQKSANTKKSNSEWLTCSDDTDKSSLTYQMPVNKCGKQLFVAYENNTEVVVNDVIKPIQWTEESKKQAFELLRIMNNDKENKPPDIKHTYL